MSRLPLLLACSVALALPAWAQDVPEPPPPHPGPTVETPPWAAEPAPEALPATVPDEAPATEPAEPTEPTEPSVPSPSPGPAERPSGFSGIRGKVTDADTGEPLAGARIKVVSGGRPLVVEADLDGNYQIPLPPGRYDLRVSVDLYRSRRIRLWARRGGTSLDVALKPDETSIEEIVVVGLPDMASEIGQLVRRRKRATMSDAISAEQISRSADSNASDAVKRMVAATVQDNRYIIIRGLGGRYSLTLLNGVPLPSPDPDVPAAPLDLFPASLLANLTVGKTFSPDLPGNVAGGVLTIETRSFPEKFMLKLRTSTAFNTASTGESIYRYGGGDLDFLGYDDGTRALPNQVPTDRLADDPSVPPEYVDTEARSFQNEWTLEQGNARPSASFGATLGDTLELGRHQIGYLTSASYGHGFVHRQSAIAKVGEPDGQGGFLPSVLQLTEDRGVEQAGVSGLASAGWVPATAQSVNLVMLYAHSGENVGSRVTGMENSSVVVDRTRLQFVEREMIFSQLVGEHDLGGGRAILGWQGNLARVTQDEPDTRDLRRTQVPDGRYVIDHGSGSSERLFGTLEDLSGGGGADLTVPITSAFKLKGGGSLLQTERTYQARRFHFDIFGDDAFLSPEEAFAPEKMGQSVFLRESTLPTDGYEASRLVSAAYVLADVGPIGPLRLVAGGRFEQAQLDVQLSSQIDLMAPPMPLSERTDRDFLPSLNAIYALSETSSLRAAYSHTVARPNFREIAPALYYDYARRRAIGGNPDLLETKIQNADLRWETFLGDAELVAASLFYKRFRDPIERTVTDAGDGQNIGFDNADQATVRGIELEARVSMGRLAPLLAPVSLGANLSLIQSRIDLEGATRPLQGQSPYVANVGLGYQVKRWGTQVDVLYNVFGRRIEEVGTGGAGNVYEEPVHRLDASLSQPLPRGLKLKLGATNLLDQRVVFTQNGVEILAYRLGVAFLGSLELSVD